MGGLRLKWLGRFGAVLRALKRKYPAAYELLQQKAKEMGVSVADLVAAMASKLLADDANADILEAAEFIARKSAEMKLEFKKEQKTVDVGIEQFSQLVESIGKLVDAVAKLATNVAESSITMLEATQRVHRKVREVMMSALEEEKAEQNKREKREFLNFLLEMAKRFEAAEKAKAYRSVKEELSEEELRELEKAKELEKEAGM